jgi:hypothetical protein
MWKTAKPSGKYCKNRKAKTISHPGRTAIATLLVLVPLVLNPSSSHAQEPDTGAAAQDSAGPVTPDSAEAIRAGFDRPPSKPRFDAVDAVELPFRIVFYPLRLLGKGTAKLAGAITNISQPREYGLFDRFVEAGVRPRFGSIGPRSSIAAGALVDRFSPFFFESMISIRGSQRHRVGLDFDVFPNRFTASYTFQREAEPHFWGIGPHTRLEDRVDYRWDHQLAAALGSARVSDVTLVGGIGYQDNRVARGFDGARTDIQDSQLADTLYGVNERAKYAVANASATFDKTYNRGLQRRGYYLEVAADLFRGVDGTDSDFHRFRGVVTGYVPANPRQALALRGIAEMNRSDGGRGVPFTHLAAFGDEAGGRAYRDGRFRDQAVLALMSEWRYEVWRELHERGRVESFLLLDTGTVGERFADMRLRHLAWSFGFGMRVVWEGQVRWLAYLAFGKDGGRLDINFSSVF